MKLQETIEKKLQDAFSPLKLEIINESHLHQNHKGSPGTGESHFNIHITSHAFEGKSRIECHRMVNEVLSNELSGPIHALAIKTSTP